MLGRNRPMNLTTLFALVPEEDVVGAFELLADDICEIHEWMPELLSYLEHGLLTSEDEDENYGPSLFLIQRWNQHQAAIDGIARTTSSVEGWHYCLQSLFQCHHPTLWTFKDGISKDIQKQKASFLQGISGVDQPPRKKYRDLKDRVGRALLVCKHSSVFAINCTSFTSVDFKRLH